MSELETVRGRGESSATHKHLEKADDASNRHRSDAETRPPRPQLATFIVRCLVIASLALAVAHVAIAEDASKPSDEVGRGVVVVSVDADSGSSTAGLLPGDVIIGWRHQPTDDPATHRTGEIRSPFDWRWLELELGPRRGLEWLGQRRGREIVLDAPTTVWNVEVRPRSTARQQALEREARGLPPGPEAAEQWHALAAIADHESVRAWALFESGGAFAAAGQWSEALEVLQVARSVKAGARADLAIERRIARTLRRAHRYDEAVERLGDVARLCADAGPPAALCRARTTSQLGICQLRLGDIEAAEALFQQAADVEARLAPDSRRLAETSRNLGTTLFYRGDLDRAASAWDRSRSLLEALETKGIELATIHQNLGSLRLTQGRLDEAERHYGRARVALGDEHPDLRILSGVLFGLGAVSRERGDLVAAEQTLTDGLIALRSGTGDPFLEADALENLGVIALDQDENESAKAYFLQSLEILREVAVDSHHIAHPLHNLAQAEIGLGDLEAAERFAEEAHAVRRKSAPDGPEEAESLTALGEIALLRGEIETAIERFERAEHLLRKALPDSRPLAATLSFLGEAHLERGDRAAAMAALERSLEIQHRVSPNTPLSVETLYLTGRAVRPDNRLEALSYFERACDVLEHQIGRLGGTERMRSTFRSRRQGLYRDYVEVLVEMGKLEQAFEVLERSRARGFLELLATRDLRLAEIPALQSQQQRTLAARYDLLQQQALQLSHDGETDERTALHEEMRAVRADYEALLESIRRIAPRAAALERPRPLDLDAARRSLAPGTALISYLVGESKSLLFAVDATGPLVVREIPIGERDLRDRIERFRRLIVDARPGSLAAAGRRASRRALGRQLYELLVGPVRDRIADAQRLMLLPDGPLHRLPWSALEMPGDGAGQGAYLVRWKPIHLNLSATVHANLRPDSVHRPDTPGDPDSTRLVAFGDPTRPQTTEVDATRSTASPLELLSRRGFDLGPLPASRREVASIAELFAGHEANAVSTYLGDEATEANVKVLELGSNRARRIVHFATHTTLDERVPLDSAVVLSLPETLVHGEDNGLLQAWEIFEQVRLDVDLVTLSSCSSALGGEQRGEGLIGLTRAFQYAGAGAVAATLWDVEDDATADLMMRFYRHLAAGAATADALRSAQIEAQEADAEPASWAAFQLYGDWR